MKRLGTWGFHFYVSWGGHRRGAWGLRIRIAFFMAHGFLIWNIFATVDLVFYFFIKLLKVECMIDGAVGVLETCFHLMIVVLELHKNICIPFVGFCDKSMDVFQLLG